MNLGPDDSSQVAAGGQGAFSDGGACCATIALGHANKHSVSVRDTFMEADSFAEKEGPRLTGNWHCTHLFEAGIIYHKVRRNGC